MTQRCSIEQIKVTGEEVLEQVERIVYEGNVRRIVVKQEGHIIAEFPLAVGVIGAALAPMLAAIGALAAALKHCTLEIERVEMLEEPPILHVRANLEGSYGMGNAVVRGEPVSQR